MTNEEIEKYADENMLTLEEAVDQLRASLNAENRGASECEIKWPEGYCRDPNGRICAPKGKDVDFNFGYDLGYYDAMSVKLDAIADFKERLNAEKCGDADFKNFHRLLCERFGYEHDEENWKRDQLSLIEHLAWGRCITVPSQAERRGEGADTKLLDWLDETNKPFQMGWRVGRAPAGNLSIQSVVQLHGKITSIREAIDAAIKQSGSRDE